ncbi:MAG: hypothetical protein WCD76_10820 [Pyrinomonadaceae bacterium]
MPLNHDGITASVYVAGVSVGCVNKQTKKWEVGFIRVPDHTLVMTIVKLTPGQRDTVVVERLIETKRIFVEADKPAFTKTSIHDPSKDDERFRLLLDLEKKVYREKRIKLKKPTVEVTELYVSKAKLYSVAGMLSKYKLRLERTDGQLDVRKIDKVGTVAGADIKCEPGGKVLVVIEGPPRLEYPLPYENDGSRYIVMFDNRCPRAKLADGASESDAASTRPTGVTKVSSRKLVAPHSDFVLLYNLVDPTGMGRFDLKEDGRRKGEGAVCNYNHAGMMEWMFPTPIV